MPPESATGTSGITTCEVAIHCAPSHHHCPSSENMRVWDTDCMRTLCSPARSPRLQKDGREEGDHGEGLCAEHQSNRTQLGRRHGTRCLSRASRVDHATMLGPGLEISARKRLWLRRRRNGGKGGIRTLEGALHPLPA